MTRHCHDCGSPLPSLLTLLALPRVSWLNRFSFCPLCYFSRLDDYQDFSRFTSVPGTHLISLRRIPPSALRHDHP